MKEPACSRWCPQNCLRRKDEESKQSTKDGRRRGRLSSRLSCSPVPFLQRYGAADLLDAALQLHMRLEHELVVPFGMSSRHGVLLRAFRAPALADRCPIAALDAEALLPVARVGGRAALCAPLCLPTGQHWHAYGSQRRRTWLGRLVVRQEHCVSVF